MEQLNLKTLYDMAKMLEIHPVTLRTWARAELIPYYRIGKKYFFRPQEVLNAAASCAKLHSHLKDISNNGVCIFNGYIHIRIGDHPMSNKSGYAPLHRIIMQAKIGRVLKKNEIVHHKNGNTIDNRIENLELLQSLGDHNKIKKAFREDK